MNRKQRAAAALKQTGLFPLSTRDVQRALEEPEQHHEGDLALSCIPASRQLQRTAVELAAETAAALEDFPWITAEADGHRVFLRFHRPVVGDWVLQHADDPDYGRSTTERPQTAAVVLGTSRDLDMPEWADLRAAAVTQSLLRLADNGGWTSIRAEKAASWEVDFGLHDEKTKEPSEEPAARVIQQLMEQELITRTEEGYAVPLSGLPPLLLYSRDAAEGEARALAAVVARKEQLDFDVLLDVSDNRRQLHIEQLRQVLRQGGWPWGGQLEHVGISEVQSRYTPTDLLKRTRELFPDAKQAAGVLLFHLLLPDRMDRPPLTPHLLGEDRGGRYIQQTYNEVCYSVSEGRADGSAWPDAVWRVVCRIDDFPETAKTAWERRQPSLLAALMLNLAEAVRAVPPEAWEDADHRLPEAACRVLRRGMFLLGVELEVRAGK